MLVVDFGAAGLPPKEKAGVDASFSTVPRDDAIMGSMRYALPPDVAAVTAATELGGTAEVVAVVGGTAAGLLSAFVVAGGTNDSVTYSHSFFFFNNRHNQSGFFIPLSVFSGSAFVAGTAGWTKKGDGSETTSTITLFSIRPLGHDKDECRTWFGSSWCSQCV